MKFRRVEQWRYKKLAPSWRRPRGKHNKVRKYIDSRLSRPLIGYKKKSSERGLHPSGLREVLVTNLSELDGIDKNTQAVMISATIGGRKRGTILAEAEKLKLKILNPGTKKEEKAEDEVEE
ncbi:50S ribosomal protein L32e [archaeon]|nr:50S ribosomal protein L32e [archaeon]